MDKTYGVVRYQIRQGSPPGGEIILCIKNYEEGNRKPPNW